jgi:hypothetical protein
MNFVQDSKFMEVIHADEIFKVINRYYFKLKHNIYLNYYFLAKVK